MSLPQPGDPFVGSNGKVNLPDQATDDTRTLHSTASVTVPQVKDYIAKTSRSIKDLFTDDQTQTVLNTVLTYTLLGLTPNEIAHLLHVDVTEVVKIQHLTAYQETFEAIFYELININSNSLQARIASYAGSSVDNVVRLAGDTEAPHIVQLKANQDILDRSGLSAQTLYDNADSDENTSLRIEILEASDTKTNININVGKKK